MRRIQDLDPDTEYEQIVRITAAHEFPWDVVQSLSFALFRTYAVPSIGVAPARHRQRFTGRTQKRYDDTTLILDALGEHGIHSQQGLTAIRRMNQMHGMYAISNDDMRYVLTTFVAVPIRWLDDYGWRPLLEQEKVASANYYREIGRLMAIRDIPETWQEFTAAMDEYEAEHFAFDPRARKVAEATLELMATFPPNHLAPSRAVIRSSRAFMDDALLDAFRFPHPTRVERVAARAAMRARASWLRRQPPRLEPIRARDLPQVQGYPGGYDVSELGTFRPGCPG